MAIATLMNFSQEQEPSRRTIGLKWARLAAFLAPMLFLTLVGAEADVPAVLGETTRVSVASDGTQANDWSIQPAISVDGRYVAFASDASNLVAGDTNNKRDIFVHDRLTGATTRVSVDSDGAQANNSSFEPGISADGRYVAFASDASNLVAGDTNNVRDVFVHDRVTGETTRVSVASDGMQANRASELAAISADGGYVAFHSDASNLVAGDTNNVRDVFVHDRVTGETTRVSVASDGTQANSSSILPQVSADGRYVTFTSFANNLVAGDSNRAWDVFVHDRVTGETTRVSVASDGTQAGGESVWPAISADGRYVAFHSWASNLIADDTNGTLDVFVHDRVTGETTRVSVASDGMQANGFSGFSKLSADGRYVVFLSVASNLVAGDTNNFSDIFMHDRVTGETTRVSVASDGTQANAGSAEPAISADGRYVAFPSYASNLVAGDTNGEADIFVHDRFPRPELVPAKVDLHPKSLNLRSRGRSVIAYISLPECCSIHDIDPMTVKLTKVNGEPLTTELTAFRSDVQGSNLLMVQFSRRDLNPQLASYSPGEVELTIEGELNEGAAFFATDWIYVFN